MTGVLRHASLIPADMQVITTLIYAAFARPPLISDLFCDDLCTLVSFYSFILGHDRHHRLGGVRGPSSSLSIFSQPRLCSTLDVSIAYVCVCFYLWVDKSAR
jgi:hypothetical protein